MPSGGCAGRSGPQAKATAVVRSSVSTAEWFCKLYSAAMPTHTPANLAPDRSVDRVLRDIRRRVRRDGGAVYYAGTARTLRKVEQAVAADPGLVADLTEHADRCRLVVTRAGHGFAWRG